MPRFDSQRLGTGARFFARTVLSAALVTAFCLPGAVCAHAAGEGVLQDSEDAAATLTDAEDADEQGIFAGYAASQQEASSPTEQPQNGEQPEFNEQLNDDGRERDEPSTGSDDVRAVPETLTVAFGANGGLGAMDPIATLAGTEVNVPPCTFGRAGFSFAGWNTAADDSGDTYEVGTAASFGKTVTLHAQWEALEGGEQESDLTETDGHSDVDHNPSYTISKTRTSLAPEATDWFFIEDDGAALTWDEYDEKYWSDEDEDDEEDNEDDGKRGFEEGLGST